MTIGLDQQLRELLDKNEIREVLLRYARGIDRRDRALIEGAFHPDGVAGIEGSAKALADYMLKLSATEPCYTHYICNQLIELDGDNAFSETYFISVWEVERDAKWFTRFRGGRYVDRFERRSGAWKISHRVTVDDWDRLDEITQRARGLKSHAHEIGAGERRGQPAPRDLVYRMRAEHAAAKSLASS